MFDFLGTVAFMIGLALILDDEVRDDLGETNAWRVRCCKKRKGHCGCLWNRCEAYGGCYMRLKGTTYLEAAK